MLNPEMLWVIGQSQRSLYRVNFGSGVIFIVLGVAADEGNDIQEAMLYEILNSRVF